MQGSVERCEAPVCGRGLGWEARVRAWGSSPAQEGGVGGWGGFSRGVGSSGSWRKPGGASPGVGGTAGPCSHSPAAIMVSLLAPGGLFEAETTRGCGEAGC